MKRLFELVVAAALMLAGPAWAAITFDNTVSGGSAAATTVELVRDTATGAPTGQYVGLKFSSSVALTNVYARAIVGGVGYALDATEAQNHALGDLSTTLRTSYWFLNIPQSTADGSLQIEIYKNGPPGVGTLEATSATYTLRSADADQSAAANKISSVVINGGSPLVLGQVFDAVVCYDVNSSAGTNVLINPASTAAFDPAGLQLLDVPQVQLYGGSGCTGTLISTTANQLYYVGAGSNSLNALRATYRFRAMNSSPITLSPIVSARSGQYKYNSDFATFPGATVPVATNNVTLAKSVNIAASAGATTVTYTLTATNSGGSAATLDSFVDTLPSSPAAVGYVAGSSQFNGAAIANPVISGQVLTWSNPGGATAFTIPAGGSRSLTFQASIPATNGLYTNFAVAKIGSLTIDTTLTTADSAPASAATRVGPPVLVVSKSTSTPVIDGLAAAYTVSVINNGGTAAAGVVLTDTLPAGFTYASHSAPVLAGGATRTATSDPAVGAVVPAWGSFNLPAGGSVSIAFVANVAASTADGTANNSASVTTSTTPATITNFDGAVQTSDNVVLASAVLAVTKSTSTPSVAQSPGGSAATYTLRVANSGSATANGVVLSDTLPAGFSYDAHSAPVLAGGATRGSVADPAVGSTAPAWGEFTLPSGASVTITFVANIAAGVADGTYDNSAGATTTTLRKSITNFDGATQGADNVSVSSAAQLNVGKTATTPTVINTSSGTQATYTLTVANTGAAPASGVTLTDSLPAGFTYASTVSVTLGGTPLAAGTWQAVTSGAQTAATPRWDSVPAGGFMLARRSVAGDRLRGRCRGRRGRRHVSQQRLDDVVVAGRHQQLRRQRERERRRGRDQRCADDDEDRADAERRQRRRRRQRDVARDGGQQRQRGGHGSQGDRSAAGRLCLRQHGQRDARRRCGHVLPGDHQRRADYGHAAVGHGVGHRLHHRGRPVAGDRLQRQRRRRHGRWHVPQQRADERCGAQHRQLRRRVGQRRRRDALVRERRRHQRHGLCRCQPQRPARQRRGWDRPHALCQARAGGIARRSGAASGGRRWCERRIRLRRRRGRPVHRADRRQRDAGRRDCHTAGRVERHRSGGLRAAQRRRRCHRHRRVELRPLQWPPHQRPGVQRQRRGRRRRQQRHARRRRSRPAEHRAAADERQHAHRQRGHRRCRPLHAVGARRARRPAAEGGAGQRRRLALHRWRAGRELRPCERQPRRHVQRHGGSHRPGLRRRQGQHAHR